MDQIEIERIQTVCESHIFPIPSIRMDSLYISSKDTYH